MKRKNKGFTLIELLAVIVILGLLMAIAIPSVTKYITQSRKKTLTTTIGNYASALVADVNNMEYIFTETNTIYAVPVECITVERGGKNPFGEWSPATENHWAYVLVQYDDTTSSYTYGFTFKDSAGYGLYPTTLENLKESGSQIQTDLLLNSPETGSYLKLTNNYNWVNGGFNVDDDTIIKVLENDSNSCITKKYCVADNEDIGALVLCGSESFYIIENFSDTLTLFARYNVDINNYKQKAGKQVTPNHFASSNYWRVDGKIKEKYGTETYPYIYDENSLQYEHIEKYNDFLKREIGVSTINAKLINIQQLVNLGCYAGVGYSSTCKDAPSWVSSTFYWTGNATGGNMLWRVYGENNSFGGNDYNAGAMGTRPVITISKSEIDFN